ncbi:diguanylate cyclase [Bacterioplanoides sp.]|uniref:diguanylate cyclase n=1 Tax=Bacterioplanoides sp. TaxID=2066072 RepID=UPI003AFFCCE0
MTDAIQTSTSLNKAQQMRQLFAHRVINQVRQVIDLWRQLPETHWSVVAMSDFTLAVEKLAASAKRFEAEKHLMLANNLLAIVKPISRGTPPDSDHLEQLNRLVRQLSETALRHSDDQQAEHLIPSKKPVYIAIEETDIALTFAEQMQYFGIRSEVQKSGQDFLQALQRRHPSALVLDINFGGPGHGLSLAAQIQSEREQNLPILFIYQEEQPDIEHHLSAMRNGGIGLYRDVEIQSVISELEDLLDTTPEDPFRILIVDDSKAQAMHSARVLNKAGMVTEAVNDPLQVLHALSANNPDLILMDMYMPGCNGMELAKVIRQQREYLNLPIIYLSGEEDRQRQLDAMAEGGDDFLTKPVEPRHLLSTIRTRVHRARQLHQLIARDSLTGLLNHTHILEALQDQLQKNDDASISFVMIDIDHFKNINDQHGHPVGDIVIKNLALFLKQSLRKSDPIGRYGGEEFAVVLPGANQQQACMVMEKLRTNFANLIHGGNKSLQVTFSCGLAQWQGESLSDLVERADQALYQAKHNGRNQVSAAS